MFELVPPTNPTSLSSPSHTPGTWSTSQQVQVIWSGAADQGSGLAGYSVVWDALPATLPDQILDLGADASGTTSDALSTGTGWTFHLRTGDRAGYPAVRSSSAARRTAVFGRSPLSVAE